ncbi:MAG: 1-(5-phosphoribosyl)-5-[(5-phosphoribosylamino)methylideneamino]imidazole-4-carboxamide isomerase [SAR202 cluster bacterium]|nr:1-(5-phosphoribosyl)-5-[(5-phosphoribosylamino)methylideneamino]imidazole-4-carboxamide isomerase [SAR202 cluster bacterium]
MEVIPAIDLKGGKCVRLFQGDYGKETVYSESPVAMARQWVAAGASRLHVVDLDGAKAGEPVNTAVIKEITLAVGVPVQVGGGIRNLAAARELTGAGVERLLIGTAAVETNIFIEHLCTELGPDAVAVSLDAKNGVVMVNGWTESSSVKASELLARISGAGLKRFIYTDVTRDGTLTEPNYGAIEALLRQTRLRMIVAGGVSSIQHLLKLSELGVEGAIIGKAIYTGDIDLAAAVKTVGGLRKG